MTNVLDDKIDKDLKVFKHNALTEAEYDLSPVPNNLMNLAVTKVKSSEQGLSDFEKTGEVVITADEYARVHGIQIDTAYKDLKRAVLELESASLICDAYYDLNASNTMTAEQRLDIHLNADRYHSNVIIGSKPKHGNFVKMKLHIKLVDRVGYSEQGALVYFRFSDDVMYLIENSDLDYTSYPYANTIDMNITPMKRMYEMSVKWANVGKCKKSVDEWRHFFGLGGKYENVAEFKRRVIEPAIKGVNKQGDFLLTLEQQKLGKTITHLIIKIKDKRPKKVENKERDANTVDMFDNLTDAERQIVDNKLAWADQQGITDPLHRQNLVNKGLKQYRQAQQAEQERQAQADAQAKAKAQAELERQQAEQAKKAEQDAEHQEWLASIRWNEYVEQFDALDDEQQAIIMQAFHDEVARTDPAKAKLIKSHHAIAKRMNQSLATIAIAISEERNFVYTIKEQLDMHRW